MDLNFIVKNFNDLSPSELYQILKLRFDIFVVEQNCIYNEYDNYDQNAIHIQLFDEKNNLIACSRIIAPNVKYKEATFGRFVLNKNERGKGIADKLADETIIQLYKAFGKIPIKIEAQAYLENFYEKFGFKAISEPYDWDGIMHIDMMRD